MRNLKRRAQADGPRTRICAQQPRGIWTNGSESWKANLKTVANLPAICRHFAGITYALPYPVAVIRCGVSFCIFYTNKRVKNVYHGLLFMLR